MLHYADWFDFVMMKDDDGFDCVMLSRLLNECQNTRGRQLLSTGACNNAPMVMMMLMMTMHIISCQWQRF